MAKRLYVGSLPYSTRDEELKELFGKVGEVSSANIIIDKMNGRSKGFGFVEFVNDADADKAVEMYNGKDFGDRKLVVNEARPMEPRANRPSGGFNRGGGDDRGGFGGGHRDSY